MACGCIDTINRDLVATHGRRVISTFTLSAEHPDAAHRAVVATEPAGGVWVNRRRRRAVTLAATFCPFCGTRYRAAEPEPAIESGRHAAPDGRSPTLDF